MLARVMIAVVVSFALASGSFAQKSGRWSRYIESPRERARVSSVLSQFEVAGQGFLRNSGYVIQANWLTRRTLEAIVSGIVDDERLTPDEADARLAQMMDLYEIGEKHAFYVSCSAFRTAGPDPVNSNGVFLQRASDPKIFVRGEFLSTSIPSLGKAIATNGADEYSYVIKFPKATEDGQKIVLTTEDLVELSVNVKGSKTVVMKFKLKDALKKGAIATFDDF